MVSGEAFANAVVSGLATGSVYALIAFGFVLVYSTTSIFNFAQGDLVMLGAVVGYGLYVGFGLPALLALVLVLVIVGLIGVVEERTAVWPVWRGGAALGVLISTLAFGIIARNIVQLRWGTSARFFPWPFAKTPLEILGVYISWPQIAAVLVAILVVLLLDIFYARTFLGKAMLATAEDREAASVRGLNVRFIGVQAFAGGAAVSALAGLVIAPSISISPQMGIELALKGFVAMAIGGFTSHRGALLGGWLFGLAEQLPTLWVDPVYKEVIGLGLLVTVLTIFPRGLLTRAAIREV